MFAWGGLPPHLCCDEIINAKSKIMKTFTRLFFLSALVIAGLWGSAQCVQPFFTYTVGTGGQVAFQNYSAYDSLASGNYTWYFGDGDSLHSNNFTISHTYSTSGSFQVTLYDTSAQHSCGLDTSQWLSISLCQGAAQYTLTQTGFGAFACTATNQSGYPGATYLWNFGDGTSSTSASPNHQFTASGNYQVSLTATSSILSCADSSHQNMSVSLCNFALQIDTSVLSVNPVDIQFAPSALNAGYTYSWTFGDGGTATTESPTHNYLTSGTYTVNLSVSDAGTSCTTTTTSTYNLDICGFNAGFGNWGNGLDQSFDAYNYDSLVNGGGTISSYLWSFPGASPLTGSGAQVSGITYPATGSYSACLYLTSTTGCKDTICHGVAITSPVYSISGSVSESGAGFSGTVYLIVQDSIGHLSLLDSTISYVDTAGAFYYTFNNLPVDSYYVKAALNTNDPNYAGYLPTYYGDVLTWGTATPVVITNANATAININMLAGSNPGGPGFVGGYVSQGAGLIIGNAGNAGAKSLGDPLSGVQVNLLTSTNQSVAYTFTDANGHYQFANIALGTYKIYVEQLNKVPNPLDFTLTAENPVDSGANMSVNSHGTTGIDNVNNLQLMEVYPNPVVGLVQMQIGCKQATAATLKLVDILGRTNLEQKVKLTSGQNTAVIDMTGMAAGVYQLVMQTGSQQITYKIVKAK